MGAAGIRCPMMFVSPARIDRDEGVCGGLNPARDLPVGRMPDKLPA
jgi:hypothetical protein